MVVVVSFTLRSFFPPEKESPCSLDRRLGVFQNQSGHRGEEKNPCLCRE
jgi:hypothetical protein